MEAKKNILVADDFTSVADCAITHACTIAKINNDSITLFHVLDSNSLSELKKHHKTVENLKEDMASRCKKYSDQYGVEVNSKIEEGSIFKSIGEKATELGCALIVLGTHGVRGMQHISGARALKVVGSSKVPLIIVQEKGPIHNSYKKIIVPIDSKSETKQKTLQCINIAKMFDAKIFLYKQFSTDEENNKNINNNITFISNQFNQHNVLFEIANQEHSGSFEKDFIGYAKNSEADLIVILTTVDKDFKDLVMGPVEEYVINNKDQIPVMCVNPMQSLYTGKSMSSIISFS
jgi:nucleotide-binding universal stress UspA family protein